MPKDVSAEMFEDEDKNPNILSDKNYQASSQKFRQIVTSCLKKFRGVCKNLEVQEKSGRSKTVDSEVFLQTIEVNLASCTQRASDENGISQSRTAELCFLLSIYYNTFDRSGDDWTISLLKGQPV